MSWGKMSHYGLKQRTCFHYLGSSQHIQPNKTGKDISGCVCVSFD